jgi:hypothetical protein
MSKRDLETLLLGTTGEDAGCEGTPARLAEYVEGELLVVNEQAYPASLRARLGATRGGSSGCFG